MGERGMRRGGGQAERWQRASGARPHSGGPQHGGRGEGRPPAPVLTVLRALVRLVLGRVHFVDGVLLLQRLPAFGPVLPDGG